MCVVSVVVIAVVGAVFAQAPAGPASRGEAAALAQGWTLLAQGNAAKAAAVAAELLKRYPRSVAALTLAVDAAVANGGASAGLDAYERWLGAKRVEDGYVLRRVARALLREAASQKDPLVRSIAIDALVADGDRDVPAATDAGVQPSILDTARQAELGNQQALDSLIEAMKSPAPIKGRAITALARSRNPRAIKPLVDALGDPDPLVRTAAAQALGTMSAVEAIPALKPLLNDPVFSVHLAAAGSLLALKDTSGLAWLQQLQTSEHAGVRLAAVQAAKTDPDASWLAVVRSLTADPDPEIRRQAAVLLAPHDPDAARGVLEPLLKDENPAQREAAAASYVEAAAGDFKTLRGFLRAAEERTRVQAAAGILEQTR